MAPGPLAALPALRAPPRSPGAPIHGVGIGGAGSGAAAHGALQRFVPRRAAARCNGCTHGAAAAGTRPSSRLAQPHTHTSSPRPRRAQAVAVKEIGSFTVRGTSRKVNEDRFDVQSPSGAAGAPLTFAGVYDGHGGSAVAEWLVEKLYPFIGKAWAASQGRPDAAMREAFLAADKELLSARTGFLGMGE